MTSVKLCT